MAYVVVGIPTYDQKIPMMAVPALMQLAKKHTLHYMPVSASLLAFAHNLCLSNARAVPHADYYINLHSDISPEPDGLVKLVDLAEKHGADVMSVISPIKDGRGVTSTGTGSKEDDWISVKRFTMKQLMKDFPPTFGQDAVEPGVLMVNTGVLLINLRRPWVKDICFTVRDRNVTDDKGIIHPVILPEDWGFSHDVYRWGAKVMVTREVVINHHGGTAYPNNIAWGEWELDQGDQVFCQPVNING